MQDFSIFNTKVIFLPWFFCETCDNCNTVATKITWLHLSIGILLSQSIVFIYQLISNGLLPDTPNLIHLLLGIGFLFLHYWNAPARYCIVEKRTSLLFYCNLDFYSSTSHLLGYNLFWFNPVEIWIFSYIALQLRANDGVILQTKFGQLSCCERSW